MQQTPLRIALVEDARGDARWFRLMLDGAGLDYQLTVFDDGRAALEELRSTPPPHIIVSDWRLPAMEFSEFMQAVRSIPACESTPVVVLTGMADPIRQDVLALGAICCLEKPVQAEQLLDLFRQFI